MYAYNPSESCWMVLSRWERFDRRPAPTAALKGIPMFLLVDRLCILRDKDRWAMFTLEGEKTQQTNKKQTNEMGQEKSLLTEIGRRLFTNRNLGQSEDMSETI